MARALATAMACQAIAVGAPSHPAPAHAAGTSVVLYGRGFGHGIGLSQWGAYGYAVDAGWTATQIVEHYYGGTVAGSAPTDATITVRLQALDGAQTAVVSDAGSLVVDELPGSGPWRSVLVRETSAGAYGVWARADAVVCPSAADTSLAGWTLVGANVAGAATIRAQTNATAGNDYTRLVALCEPTGKVRAYRGAIRAVNGPAGEDRTINEVPVEQYLRAVVAKEMSPGWATAGGGRGVEALKAQAIAGRSYALAERRYSYAHTCDQICQTYQGAAVRATPGSAFVAVEHALSDPAVAATAGMVRRTTAGAYAVAMYSASSGGHTAPSSLGFTPRPDGGDGTSLNPNNTWTVTVPASSITAAYPAIGTYTGLAVTARDGYGEWGGRATSVRITGTAASVTVTGEQFRMALGLKSAWFSLEPGTRTGADTVAPGATASAPAVRMRG